MPKVLILEDEALISLALQNVLVEAGFRPFAAPNVKDALELCDRNEFSAAVLDWRLADGDAGAVLNHLKKRSTPVVVLTGDEMVRRMGLDGAIVFSKPYPMDKVVGALEAQIRMESRTI